MKKRIIFLLLGLLISHFSRANDVAAKNTVSVMSYNIRNAKGLDGITDYQRLADVIRREAPDVVAVQELDSITGRSKGADVLREIAGRALMYSVYGASIPYDGGKYGLGVLSRERPLNCYSVVLPGREEQRQLFVVEFERYVIGCTHLSLTEKDRMSSVDIIKEEAAKAKKPFFLAGDLNATPESGVMNRLQKDFLLLNNIKNFTIPADKPAHCIDYIAYYTGRKEGAEEKEKPFTVLSNRVVEEPVASDHRPVIVNIRFKAKQSEIFRTLPYLQNPADDGITVMWQTHVPVYSWVEYGTDTVHLEKAHLLRDGQVICNNTNHKIRLTDLQAGQRYYYRVCSREMTLYQAYYKEFGATAVSRFYSFALPAPGQTDFTALLFNDLHKRQATYDALLKQVKDVPYDFAVFNGDCIDDPASEDQALEHLSLYCEKINASEKPVFFLRGNHEIRNAYSIGLRDLFDYVGNKTYGAFNWGDTRFVMFDCGEDKPDTTQVYYGLNDFEQLRLDQREFLKKEIAGKAFQEASKRVLIGHVPIYGNSDRYSPGVELWADVLAKAPFNISISGHIHQYSYHPKGTVKNNPFPEITGGAPQLEKATVMVLRRKGAVLTLTVLNARGETILEKELQDPCEN
ncbi:MAG: metallophosphoesterase [Tannerella sp.]|jgi:endonuclease/exonuclease/phosphatase family metal-dependent hydrolase/Icc-related predicted phosphoesterase|nr:metallophosphoesterase [Tannerella sp.]